MTCTLLTAPSLQRIGRDPAVRPADSAGSTRATRILDHDHPDLGRFDLVAGDEVDLVRQAHAAVTQSVRPVYALDETQPSSVTLRRGRGSCSQRMALVESLVRRHGVATRVRGLVVDGRFWQRRFRLLRPAVPGRLLLAWPEFAVDDTWVEIGSLFDADDARPQFVNAGTETLFDAIGHGQSPLCTDGGCASPSLLTALVTADLGTYPDRDTLVDRWGQNLPLLRHLADPVLSRWSAGGR